MDAPQKHSELHELLDRLCVGALSDDERRSLNDLLRTDDEACLVYLRYMALHSTLSFDARDSNSLNQEAGQSAAGDSPSKPTALTSGPHSWVDRALLHPKRLSLVAAALVVCLILTAMALVAPPFYRDMVEQENGSEPQHSMAIVARVTGLHEVQWTSEGNPARLGAHLRSGRLLQLDVGLAEVTYHRGARVILEGPAVYEIRGANDGYLKRGKLVAKVTQETAKGFTVDTPAARAKDLGTEFGLRVDPDGFTVTHVFEGKVLVSPVAGASWQPRELVANQTHRAGKSSASLLAANAPVVGSFVGTLPRSENPTLAALVSVDIGANNRFERRATVSAEVGDHREADLNDPGQNATDDQIGIWSGTGSTNWWNSSAAAATALVDADGNMTRVSYRANRGIGTEWAATPTEDLLWDGYYVGDGGTIITKVSGLPADTMHDLIIYHATPHVSEVVTVNGASAIDYTGSLANAGYGDAFDGLAGSDFWYFQVATSSSGELVIYSSGGAFNTLTGFQLRPLLNVEHEPN